MIEGVVRTEGGCFVLEAVGVSRDEEAVYRLLLARPGAGPDELAQTLGCETGLVRTALARLETLGLAGRRPGNLERWTAARPDLALDALVAQRERELSRVRLAAQALLAEMVEDGAPGRLVEVISGRQAVSQRFHQLAAGAREELLVLDRPPYATSIRDSPTRAALRRGVTVRTVYARESLDEPEGWVALREHVAAGELARVLADLPLKLALADRRLAILPLTLHANAVVSSAILVHASPLLDALVALVETLWRIAMPVPDVKNDGVPTGEGPTAEERELLALLAAGLKDEAIARQLGIGVRTLQRRLARLMERLGVQTRFQVGVRAAQRGWL